MHLNADCLSRILTLSFLSLGLSLNPAARWFDCALALARYLRPAVAVGCSPGVGEPGPIALARGPLAESSSVSRTHDRRDRRA